MYENFDIPNDAQIADLNTMILTLVDNIFKWGIWQCCGILHESFIFMPTLPPGRVVGAAAPGGLEIAQFI